MHFRTTAIELLLEATDPDAGYVAATHEPIAKDGLDGIAAELRPEHRELAREFLIFLRESDRVDATPE